MPDGAPGDHPLTDIFVHNIEGLSPEIDGYFREIEAIGGWAAVVQVWDDLENDPELDVWKAVENKGENKEELDRIAQRVRSVRDQLKREAD